VVLFGLASDIGRAALRDRRCRRRHRRRGLPWPARRCGRGRRLRHRRCDLNSRAGRIRHRHPRRRVVQPLLASVRWPGRWV